MVIAKPDSLRELCNGLSCCLGKLVYLGVSKPLNKSNLSYANMHHMAALFKSFLESHSSFQAKKDRPRYRTVLQGTQAEPESKNLGGMSENALLIRIRTALTSMLLLKVLHHPSKDGWALPNMPPYCA